MDTQWINGLKSTHIKKKIVITNWRNPNLVQKEVEKFVGNK
jgi:hypothetical protein